MSDSRQKMRAVFLAFVMVMSVFGATIAFSGSAAAASGLSSTSVTADGESFNDIQKAGSQAVDIDVTVDGVSDDNSDDTVTIDLTDSFTVSNVDTLTVTESNGDTLGTSSSSIVNGGGTNDAIDVTVTDDNDGSSSFTVSIDATVDASSVSEGSQTVTAAVTDTNGNDISATQIGSLEVDDTAPTIQSVTKVSGTSSTVEVTFTEAVTDDTGSDQTALEQADFDYIDNDGSGEGADAFASIDTTVDADNDGTPDPNVVRLTVSDVITTGELGTDEIAVDTGDGSPIQDLADNTAPSSPSIISPPSLQGPSINGEVDTQIDGGAQQTIQAGVANNSLGQIQLRDIASGGGSFAGETTITLPEGVTVNTGESSLSTTTIITSNGDTGTTIDDVSVSDDQQSIVLSHSGTSVNSETIRIASGALVVNVDGDEIDTTGTSTSLDIDVAYFSDSGTAALLSASHPNVVQNSQSNVDINGENLDAGNLRIDTGDYDADDFGNNTEIVLSVESGTGVTFDTDNINADSSLVANTDLDTSSTDDELDPTAATISEDEIRVPVVNEITQTDNNIRFNNLAFATNGTATDADLNVTVESVPASSGPYQLNGNGDDTPTVDDFVTVDTPSISLAADDSIAVGATDQTVNEDLTVDLSNVALSAGSELQITTNNSAVTFADPGLSGDGTDLDEEGATVDPADIDTVDVASDVITITFSADPGANTISFGSGGDLVLDADTSAADETAVSFDATFDSAVEINSGDTNVITLDRPSTVLNDGNNATVILDNDGTQTTVDPAVGTRLGLGDTSDPVDGNARTDNAIVIQADDVTGDGVMVGADTNVLVSLESGTGVTFDQSADSPSNTLAENDDIDIDESSNVDTNDDLNDGSAPSITENEITIPIDAGDGGLDSGEGLVIDELPLNVSSGAQNTTLSVTTTTGSGNDVTTAFEEQIIVQSADKGSINGDADITSDSGTPQDDIGPNDDGSNGGDFGGTDTGEASTSLEVDNSVDSAVLVRDSNNNAFGGANVDLEVVKQPDGASASLNRSALTTNSNGIADFEFTAGQVSGEYIVNATSNGQSVNLTYTANPGPVSDVEVSAVENALAGADGSDTETAAVLVNATDEFGNAKASSTSASLTTSGTSTDFTVGDGPTADSLNNDGTENVDGGALDTNTGDLTIDSDGSTALLFGSSNPGEVTISVTKGSNSDSASVTFFDEVGAVDMNLNQSTAAPDDTVAANATLSTGDGTQINVPDIQVSFDDGASGNTSFIGGTADSATISTNNEGVASASVSADQLGTSTISATENLKSDSATITVEEAGPPTATVTFNDQSVQNGSTTVNVASATFNGSEAFNIVVHQASDDNDDGTIQASEIGQKIGESAELESGTSTDILVNISKQVADNDNVSQLTANQTLVAMLHTTNTSDNDNIVHTASITRDGTPVFDQAEITIEDEQTVNVGGEDVPVEFTTTENGETTVTSDDAVTAIRAFINDEPGVDSDTAVSVIRAFINSNQ